MLKALGIKSFFKGVYNKVIKTYSEKKQLKYLSKDPMKALQVASQLGSAAASKNPQAIMHAGMQAGKFTVLGKGVPKEELLKLVN